MKIIMVSDIKKDNNGQTELHIKLHSHTAL